MNLTAVAAHACTVGAFVPELKEESDSAGHCHTSRPRPRASADAITSEAPAILVVRRQVGRGTRMPLSVAQHTSSPRGASLRSSAHAATRGRVSAPSTHV